MSEAQSRMLRKHAAVVVGILVVACTKPDSGSVGKASDTTAPGEVGILAAKYLVGPPGMDEAATKEYIEDDIDFGGKTKADSAYTGPFDCASCERSPVTLTIVPEEKSYKVDWNYAFRNSKRRGYIVAKIYNDDNVEFKPLQIPPGDSIYMWVGPISADGVNRAAAFYKIASDGKVIAGPLMAKHTVLYCDNPKWEDRTHAAAKAEHADDGPCYESKYPGAPVPAAAKKVAYTTVAMTHAMFAPSGAWLSCVYGCCEVGALDQLEQGP